jgi:hypothetical protein
MAPASSLLRLRTEAGRWEPAAKLSRLSVDPSEASMSIDLDEDEPEVLPEEIVHWQPNHRPLNTAHAAVAQGASATGSSIVGALALGALAIGAVAIGALAIGRLNVRHARFGRVVIDDLVVKRLRVLER